MHRHGDLAAANSSLSTSPWVSRLSLMSSAALKLESPPFCGRGRARSDWESQSRGEVWIRDWGGRWGFQAHLGRIGAVNLQPARPRSPRQLRCSNLRCRPPRGSKVTRAPSAGLVRCAASQGAANRSPLPPVPPGQRAPCPSRRLQRAGSRTERRGAERHLHQIEVFKVSGSQPSLSEQPRTRRP